MDPAEKGEGEANEAAVREEGAEHLATVELGANHGGNGHDVAGGGQAPGATLHLLAGEIFGGRCHPPHGDRWGAG